MKITVAKKALAKAFRTACNHSQKLQSELENRTIPVSSEAIKGISELLHTCAYHVSLAQCAMNPRSDRNYAQKVDREKAIDNIERAILWAREADRYLTTVEAENDYNISLWVEFESLESLLKDSLIVD